MTNTPFTVSTAPNLLDVSMIHQFLSQEAYWSKGRSLEAVETAIQHSLCFGVYAAQQQVGFARVVTDYAIFAWVMDVFILPAYRGQGAGKLLIKTIVEHPSLASLSRWGLMTHDAHSLYESVGFQQLAKPEIHMEYVPPLT